MGDFNDSDVVNEETPPVEPVVPEETTAPQFEVETDAEMPECGKKPDVSGSYTEPYRTYNENGQFNPPPQSGHENPNESDAYGDVNQAYQEPRRYNPDAIGFGIASLVFGILTIVFFLCCAPISAIFGLVFGIIQLARYPKKGLAICGIVTSAVGFLMFMIAWIVMFNSATFQTTIEQQIRDELNTETQDSDDPFEDFFELKMNDL